MQKKREHQTVFQLTLVTNSVVIRPSIRKLMTVTSQSCNISIEAKKWGNLGLNTICRAVKSWGIQTALKLCDNREQKILDQIKNISFPKLQWIDLSNNQITTIEVISQIDLPLLQKLTLRNNLIAQVSSLRKMNCPELRDINLGKKNSVSEYAMMSQLHAPHLITFTSEWVCDKDYCSDSSWVLKLESSQLEKLYVRSSSRMRNIQQWTSMEKLHRKRKQITIYIYR